MRDGAYAPLDWDRIEGYWRFFAGKLRARWADFGSEGPHAGQERIEDRIQGDYADGRDAVLVPVEAATKPR